MAAHQPSPPMAVPSQSPASGIKPLVDAHERTRTEIGDTGSISRSHRAHTIATTPTPSFVISEPPSSPVNCTRDDFWPTRPATAAVEEHSLSIMSPPPAVRRLSSLETGHRRGRGISMPLSADDLYMRTGSATPVPSPSVACIPAAVEDPPPKLSPLSYHHVVTLHQLGLPRPLSNPTSSRTSLIHYKANPLFIPSLEPPITSSTLHELDLTMVLRNPQLRHDIIFDPHLMFRPNFDGERGAKKRQATERYWEAVAAEVERGCRCAAWTVSRESMLPCVCAALGTKSKAIKTLIHGGRQRAHTASRRPLGKSTGIAAKPLASRLPSRIPALIEELKNILISLLPSPTQQQHGLSSRQISSVLDVELITQELEHGVLDVLQLAHFLGATLKLHCAPMRDDAVDHMVTHVREGRVAAGLRVCFELLELMKLVREDSPILKTDGFDALIQDIANHQLRSLRPFLLETALDYELKVLYDVHDVNIPGVVAFQRTRRWFYRAVARSGSRNVSRAICDGILELIFDPTGLPTANVAPSRSKVAPSPSISCQIPETLHLDVVRLQSFHADLTDLTVVCLLLLLYRQLYSSTPGCSSPTEFALDQVRRDVWVLISQPVPAKPSKCPGHAGDDRQPVPSGSDKLENATWRDGLRDAALQLSKHLTGDSVPSPTEQAVLTGWLDTNVRADSELYLLVQRRLRVALLEQIEVQKDSLVSGDAALLGLCGGPPLGGIGGSPADIPAGCVKREAVTQRKVIIPISHKRRRSYDLSDESTNSLLTHKRPRFDSPPSYPSACLDPLKFEVRALAERISRVAAFHLRVYHGWYAALLSGGLPPTLIVHLPPSRCSPVALDEHSTRNI